MIHVSSTGFHDALPVIVFTVLVAVLAYWPVRKKPEQPSLDFAEYERQARQKDRAA